MKLRTTPVAKRILIALLVLGGLVLGGIAGFIPTQLLQATSQQPNNPAPQAKRAITAFQGQVINIVDGDSITVRAGNENFRIRLAEIDAPERGQPWGTRSKQDLAAMVAGKTVTIQPRDTDRYGRTIALVFSGGRNINQDMVALGSAWAYRAYLRDSSFLQTEAGAREPGGALGYG